MDILFTIKPLVYPHALQTTIMAPALNIILVIRQIVLILRIYNKLIKKTHIFQQNQRNAYV